jgi:hypothetical protein
VRTRSCVFGRGEPSAGDDSGALDKSGYGQSCGTDDLDRGIGRETQVGGYHLISVKAKPGIVFLGDEDPNPG